MNGPERPELLELEVDMNLYNEHVTHMTREITA